jgi:hypothetical protein
MAPSRLAGDEERYLTVNESLIVSVRRHPIVLVRPSLEFTGAIVVAGYVLPPSGGSRELNDAVSIVLLVLLVRLLWKIFEWWSVRIVLTDKRIFETRGLVIRLVGSMPLRKMTDMTYQRTPLGSLLGYGDFKLESAGQEQPLSHIRFVPEPDTFYRTVFAQVFATDQRGRGRPASADD